MSLLGIDIGTTGCKAAAFSSDGTCLVQSYREYSTHSTENGIAELDSRSVWKSTCGILSEAASRTKQDPITALSISAMGEAVTPVRSDRTLLRNCILSSDTRGKKYIQLLLNHYGQQAFYEINPNILATNYTLPKIMWIRENEPEIYKNTDTFLLWEGLVGFMLGADPFISYSQANRTLLFDIRSKDWSNDILQTVGLDRDKLPACVPAGTAVGTVADSLADELGLPHGIRIVSGGHDQCCSALGAGLSRPGRAADGIGTYECITPVYNHIPASADMIRLGLNIEHHVVPGLYVSFLYNQGGVLLRWFRDTFAKEIRTTENIYDCLAREMPDDPTRLFTLPYFEMTGSPDFISNASGAIIGLKTHTTRGEIFKSIMESITFYFCDSLASLKRMGIDTSEFIASGGGARSDAWLQIKADIFGVPFVRPRFTECGLAGTAILAGKAAGDFDSLSQGVASLFSAEKTFEPNPERHSIYRERSEKYNQLFPMLKEFMAEMHLQDEKTQLKQWQFPTK